MPCRHELAMIQHCLGTKDTLQAQTWVKKAFVEITNHEKKMKFLHAEMIAELAIIRAAFNEAGVAIAEARGQMDIIFLRLGMDILFTERDSVYNGFEILTRKEKTDGTNPSPPDSE